MSAAASPYRTVLVACRDRVARADVPRRGDAAVVHSLPRGVGGGAGAIVEAAARLAGPLSRDTWVVSDDVQRYDVALPKATVKRMGSVELEAALAFEAQPLSGLAPAQAAVGWDAGDERGGDRLFGVVEVALAERDEIRETVERYGGRLVGILHPSGVPARLTSPGTGGAWRRVEAWRDGALEIVDDGDGRVRRGVRAPRPDAGPSEPATEALVAAGGLGVPPAGEVVRLAEPDGLAAWLGAWARVVSRRTLGVPHVPPPSLPLSPSAKRGLAVALAALAVGACWGHHVWDAGRLRALEEERKAVVAPAEALRRAEGEVRRRTKEVTDAKAALAKAQADGRTAAHARTRLVTLLSSIAESVPRDARVDEIDAASERIAIRGRCTRPEAVDDVVAALVRDLAAEGYRVGAPSRSAVAGDSTTGTYGFEIVAEGSKSTEPAREEGP